MGPSTAVLVDRDDKQSKKKCATNVSLSEAKVTIVSMTVIIISMTTITIMKM